MHTLDIFIYINTHTPYVWMVALRLDSAFGTLRVLFDVWLVCAMYYTKKIWQVLFKFGMIHDSVRFDVGGNVLCCVGLYFEGLIVGFPSTIFEFYLCVFHINKYVVLFSMW